MGDVSANKTTEKQTGKYKAWKTSPGKRVEWYHKESEDTVETQEQQRRQQQQDGNDKRNENTGDAFVRVRYTREEFKQRHKEARSKSQPSEKSGVGVFWGSGEEEETQEHRRQIDDKEAINTDESQNKIKSRSGYENENEKNPGQCMQQLESKSVIEIVILNLIM